jgi:two-component system osmolarity sensor histidine kinase EnvZ
MTALDSGIAALRTAASTVRAAASRTYALYDRVSNAFRNIMPKGLYARALLIIIMPMVLLQSVIAFVFMERHWNSVTPRWCRTSRR